MTTYTNNAEGGTSGTTVTTGNSGGASGNAWDLIAIGTASTLTFDNAHAAHGTLAYKIVCAANVGTYLRQTFGSPVSSVTARMYLYFTANPAGATAIFGWFSTNTVLVRAFVSSTGKLTIASTAGGTAAMTTSIPLNAWFRVDMTATISATVGAATLNRYDSMDSVTVTDTVGQTGANYGGSTSNIIRVGLGTVPSGFAPTYWVDDIAYNDTGAAIGPIATAATSLLVSERRVRRNHLLGR